MAHSEDTVIINLAEAEGILVGWKTVHYTIVTRLLFACIVDDSDIADEL
jgi:hypothetical protein